MYVWWKPPRLCPRDINIPKANLATANTGLFLSRAIYEFRAGGGGLQIVYLQRLLGSWRAGAQTEDVVARWESCYVQSSWIIYSRTIPPLNQLFLPKHPLVNLLLLIPLEF